jgi:hypothetical protein
VNVELQGLETVAKRLRFIPGGARVALVRSILKSLRSGRTASARAARERYVIPYGWLLKAIGRPRMSALTGYLHVSGTKAPLSMFNAKSIYPGGVEFQELKDHVSVLRHAFVHGSGPVLERETKETPRYPLRTIFGRSAPEMIGMSKVFPKIQDQMEIVLYAELERQIKGILSGEIPTN